MSISHQHRSAPSRIGVQKLALALPMISVIFIFPRYRYNYIRCSRVLTRVRDFNVSNILTLVEDPQRVTVTVLMYYHGVMSHPGRESRGDSNQDCRVIKMRNGYALYPKLRMNLTLFREVIFCPHSPKHW